MKSKVFLASLGFFYMSMVGGCSQPATDVSYQLETDRPCQTMTYFGASDAPLDIPPENAHPVPSKDVKPETLDI